MLSATVRQHVHEIREQDGRLYVRLAAGERADHAAEPQA